MPLLSLKRDAMPMESTSGINWFHAPIPPNPRSGLKKLHHVSGRVLAQHLAPAETCKYLVPEYHALRLQRLRNLFNIIHREDKLAPPTGLRFAAVGHRFRR